MTKTIRSTEKFLQEATARFPLSARDETNTELYDKVYKVKNVFRKVNPMLIHPLVIKRSKEGDSVTPRGNTFKLQSEIFF